MIQHPYGFEDLDLAPEDAAKLCGDTAVRRLVLELLASAQQRGWPFLSDLLRDAFRGGRHPPADQRLVARALHALVRGQRLLSFATREKGGGAAQLDAMLAMSGIELPARRRGEGLAALGERIAAITDPVARLGVTHSLPDWLVQLVLDDLGVEAGERACARLDRAPPRSLRVNTLRATREGCTSALARAGASVRPAAHAPTAIITEGAFDLFATEPFRCGWFELQDEASQLVADVVAPPPRSLVVDACAGSGGKTLALGALMGGRGRLVAVEPVTAKLAELRRRAERAGLHNVRTIAADLMAPREDASAAGSQLRRLERAADRVLVDAPCSGLGALRRNPEARWRLRPDDLTRLGALQRGILARAADLVGPGGRVVYATCSFLGREGREVARAFASGRGDFVAMPVREVLGATRAAAITDPSGVYLDTWGAPASAEPSAMDGFFAAVLRRPRARR